MLPINTHENESRTGFTSTKIDIKAFWLAALRKYSMLLHLALTAQKPGNLQTQDLRGEHQHPITINYKTLYLITSL